MDRRNFPNIDEPGAGDFVLNKSLSSRRSGLVDNLHKLKRARLRSVKDALHRYSSAVPA